jgi:hypothetical protein
VMQLGSRIRRVFGVEMPLPELFDAPTLGRQAGRIDRARCLGSRTTDQPIRRLARTSTIVRPDSANDARGEGR